MKRAFIFLTCIFIIVFGVTLTRSSFFSPSLPPEEKTIPSSTQSSRFSYQGETGVSALALLERKSSIEFDRSGLVVSINGRKAESKSREYWGFYINGELASVGPKEYMTSPSDMIEWRIDKY